jgi:hypothetical protein
MISFPSWTRHWKAMVNKYLRSKCGKRYFRDALGKNYLVVTDAKESMQNNRTSLRNTTVFPIIVE